jgi:hypothetical protein
MTRSDSVRPQTPKRPSSGSLEDRYQSLFLLGRGGMGRIEVALERGGKDTERIVALKRLLPENARDPRRKEMFLREARLGALLIHPNVVRGFAFGEIYDELFMAMEYVEGEPLSRVLAALHESGRKLDLNVTCHVLADVCEGLHAAHELADTNGKPLNVVHRDVSPQNVMIAYDGQVKLLDFGVAKLDTAGHQTRTGEVKGKMAYMSPEQALGDKLDRRSDLFSIGAVLFECVTGRTMWGAGTDVELMRKLALEQPPRLDATEAQIPERLAALHGRLVAREPTLRPDTAHEVASELRIIAFESESGDPRAALAALMGDLFAPAAAARRALLATALAREGPSRLEALRRTLEPGAVLRQSSTAEPVLVHAPGGPRKALSAAVLAGAILATIGATAVVGASAMRAPSEPRASSAKTGVASTGTRTAASASTETSTGTGTGTSTGTSTSTSTSTGPDTRTDLSGRTDTGASTTAVLAASRPFRAATASSGSLPSRPSGLARTIPAPQTKAPDVDPSPF